MTKTEQRRELHRSGLQALRAGEFDRADRELRRALDEFGPYVGVIADLAFVAYLRGRMGEFRLFVASLETELAKAEGLLSIETQLKMRVALAKFHEELGRVADAFDQVEATLALMPPGHKLDFQVRAQRLRMLASFGKENELEDSYRLCLNVGEERPQILIECFHGLLLAEARLFGFQGCRPRLLELRSRGDLQAADLRLCLIDLLEIALETANADDVASLLELIGESGMENLDAYEKTVLRIANTAGWLASEDEVYRWSREVSPMCLMRLLALDGARTGGTNRVSRERLTVLIDSFDHRTRQILMRKWRHLFQASAPLEIVLQNELQAILCGTKTVSFERSPQAWTLLRAVAEKRDCASETLLSALGRAHDISEQETLRISILRLNKRLCSVSGLDWVVKHGKTGISVRPSVQFRVG